MFNTVPPIRVQHHPTNPNLYPMQSSMNQNHRPPTQYLTNPGRPPTCYAPPPKDVSPSQTCAPQVCVQPHLLACPVDSSCAQCGHLCLPRRNRKKWLTWQQAFGNNFFLSVHPAFVNDFGASMFVVSASIIAASLVQRGCLCLPPTQTGCSFGS